MVYLYDACDQISDFCHHQLLRKMRRKISWTDGRTDRGKKSSGGKINYWWQKSDIWSQASYRYPISWEAFLDPSDSYFLFADFVEKCAYMFNVYKNQQNWQTGSRNLMGSKTLPTILGTYMKLVTKYSDIWSQASYRYTILWVAFLDPSDSYFLFADFVDFLYTLNIYAHFSYMKLVTKYQISAINSGWEKCDEKWAYMFNVYKNQQSQQTGSRNLMGPKTLPTIWGTDMKLVTACPQDFDFHQIFSKWQVVGLSNFLYPRSPKGEGGILFYLCPSVRPSVLPSFRQLPVILRIFDENQNPVDMHTSINILQNIKAVAPKL
jgi:hypothetical protein